LGHDDSKVGFPTTDWSLISAARLLERDPKGQSLERLLVAYTPAIRRYLLKVKRLREDDAADVLQGFLADKVVNRVVLSNASGQQGRFRNYLLRSLEHYIIDRARRASASTRPPIELALSIESVDTLLAVEGDISESFEREWARSVIATALSRTAELCARRSRRDWWAVFLLRIVAPITEGARPVSYRELVERLAFSSPVQASNALITVKRLFDRTLRRVLAEHAPPGADMDDELRELRAILARRAEH